ncbi:MAG TPA: rhomboid family intramembrane serine protease [Micromonosporaceae bacterium]|nr:rhomboid family intramembrane serine protease [Micromonosporaceae bacterium]HCU49718.1 rhomboid family intramembrane serine protease [Micromonosporaceae bacterium]
MVIPVHDINPVRRVPWLTYGLIAANIIVFLRTPAAASLGIEDLSLADLCRQEAFYRQYGAIPQEMLTNEQLSAVPTGQTGTGPSGPGCVVAPPTYEKFPALSVFNSMFLHAGWLHLLGNMLFLAVFGNNIEDRMGRLQYLLFYLLSGYVAAYGFALSTPDATVPLIGASGAVSGVLGAYLVLYPWARVWSLVPILLFLPLKLPAWLVLGMWFALQWIYATGYAVSEAGSVAYLAHVLGFAVGVVVAIPLRIWQSRPKPPPSPIQYRRIR